MIPHYKNIHNLFKINGFHPTTETLFQLSYSFIKEGEDFEKQIGNFLLDWLDNKDFIETETSGSTGKPKLIKMQKQAMVNSAIATGNFFDLHPGNKALHCLPTKYIAGKMMLVRAIILGLEIDLVNPAGKMFSKLHTEYDFAAMVPLQVENNLENLQHIKKLIIGGVAPSVELVKRIKKLPSTKIYETYGMTETITHIAAKEIGKSYFKLMEGVSISLNDKDCLVINAPRISEEAIVTNDLVEIKSKNQFKWLGRIDNVINSGGIKIIPEVIEEKLSNKIQEKYFIASKPDNKLGEKVILVVEGNEKSILDTKVFDGLEKHEQPKEVVYVKKFKMTPTDKINRSATLKLI
ncbi:AMP-binding protein [Flavobacterium haoranii]|uniref:O-succinylbenzoic acid--CoA ligase n=1 Tax=Flavobacterium haoranii TaxID=683124 RepID=A0A1M6HCS6_9FLAO|nr:AMP-binding protein [Flavobacterium haoranii]SHJ19966.1 O-succinylbenzoic acid--CoA ligase [Flavobacterium haoranii]